MITFEGYERRIDKINAALKEAGIKDLEEARQICLDKGIDVEKIVKGIQPIAFDNAVWAYTVGAAIALKSGVKTAVASPFKLSCWASKSRISIGCAGDTFCVYRKT